MKLESELQCDVLIVGSGIAGLQAADAASEKGARVILISQGELFSGASFYPGTWGFGLIAPDGENDKKGFGRIHSDCRRGNGGSVVGRGICEWNRSGNRISEKKWTDTNGSQRQATV